MPRNVVSIARMEVGGKGGGRHWTQEEVRRRQEAADGLTRKKQPRLRPPEWLLMEENAGALRIWKRVLREARAFTDYLDNLDAATLATYCLLQAEFDTAAASGDQPAVERLAKALLPYIKALALSPEARARLVKKKSDVPDDPTKHLFA